MRSALSWSVNRNFVNLSRQEQILRVQDDALEESLCLVEAEMKKYPNEKPTAREMDIISALANVRSEILQIRAKILKQAEDLKQ